MRKLLLFLCCMSIWLCAPARAAVAVTGGDGWSYDDNSRTLSITGDYVWAERGAGGGPAKNPWYECRKEIRKVTLSRDVTSIGDDAFADCDDVSVDYGEAQVRTIGRCAFKESHYNLYSFFPKNSSNLTSIGDSAYYGCCARPSDEYKLEAVVPPDLGKDVFSFTPGDDITLCVPNESVDAYKASDWAKYFIIIPERIESDGWFYFGNTNCLCVSGDYVWAVRDSDTPARNPWYEFRHRIREIALVNLTSIGDDAFAGCDNINSGSFGGIEIETIGKCAFSGCSYSAEYFLKSASLTSIGDSAFFGYNPPWECTFNMKAVVPPALGKDVFSFTSSDGVKLYVPSESAEAYKASDWAKYFVVVPVVTDGDGWSFDRVDSWITINGGYVWAVRNNATPACNPWYEFCGAIRGVKLEKGVTSIGDDAFADSYGVSVNYVDAQVKTIGKCAFKGSWYISLVFPWGNSSSLTSIGDSAFYGCPVSLGIDYELEVVVPPTLGKDVFSFTASDSITLLVPSESVAAYEASDWAKYFVIEGYQSTAIDAVPAGAESRPKVENGVVTVGGEPAREVYSLSGRRMPAGVPLPRGIYVVATPAGAVRVAVK